MKIDTNLYPEIPPVLTVQDVRDILRISRSGAYRLVNSGEIRALTIGKQLRIPREEFLRYLSSNA